MAFYRPLQVTEREPDYQPGDPNDPPGWEDCTWASGVMAANAQTKGNYPATLAEAERLRAASGEPPGGGSNIGDLTRGMMARYGWAGATVEHDWTKVSKALAVGRGAVLQGSMGSVSTHLRRWDPGFRGGHAVYVQRERSGALWWMNPQAPATYQGEEVTDAQAKTYFLGLAGSKAMVVTLQEAEMGLAVYLTATRDTNPWDDFGSAKLTSGSILRVSDGASVNLAAGTSLGTVQVGTLDGKAIVAFNHSGELHVADRSRVTFTPMAPPSGPADCSAEVAAALAQAKVECDARVKRAEADAAEGEKLRIADESAKAERARVMGL